MDIVSLGEFRQFCRENRFDRIVYSTENNLTVIPAPLHMSMSFQSVTVIDTPERKAVILKSPTGALTLENIQKVKIDNRRSFISASGKPCGWVVIEITCKLSTDRKAQTHRLLADY